MKKHRSSATAGQVPFPGAAPSKQQRAEDAFMQRHGGRGNRLIYSLIEAVSFAGKVR